MYVLYNIMSFTRFNYDSERSAKLLQESSDPGRWILNTPGNGTHPHYYEDPQIRAQKWGGNVRDSETGHVVDIASELDGRNRVQTRYGSIHRSGRPLDTSEKTYPSLKPYVDETRATHPAMIYRDLEQVRWEYPLLDPQANTCKPFHSDESTRIKQKNDFILRDEMTTLD